MNNIANRTPLIRMTNAAIGNSAPHVYLTDPKIVGSDPIEDAVSTHLVDFAAVIQPFTAELYDKFLVDRTERIRFAIRTVVGAEPSAEDTVIG